MKISTKIFIPVISLIVILGGATGIYFIQKQEEFFDEEFRVDANLLVDRAATDIEYSVITGDIDALTQEAKRILEIPNVSYIRVVDEHGKMLFDGGLDQSGQFEEFVRPLTMETVADSEEALLLGDARSTEIKRVGTVVLGVSYREFVDRLAEMRRAVLIFVLSASFLAMVLVLWLVNTLLKRPMVELVLGTQRIAAGDLQYKVKEGSKDELGRLAQAFNQMTEDLKKLTVSRDYVDNIVASITDALIVIGKDSKVTTANKAANMLFGDEIIGTDLSEAVVGQEFFSFNGFIARSRGGTITNREMYVANLTNKRIPVLCSGAVLKDRLGAAMGIVLLVQDITERKRSEEELKKAYEQLKETQGQLLQSEKMASIGQLAAGVAHEINNPVGFIASNIQSLADYMKVYDRFLSAVEDLKAAVGKDDMQKAKDIIAKMAGENAQNLDFVRKDVGNLLEESQKGVERVKVIVNDLRTFAREGEKKKELVSVEDVIEGVLRIVENEIKYKADLKKEYGTTPKILCNSQQLGQVFINLLINAVQAMDNNGQITIRTFEDKGFVCAAFSDTGRGIPPDIINKIFDPFFTTKPVGKGTGLGLSISYEIIKKIGGTITVDSVPGKGTTFTVMILVPEEEEIKKETKSA